MHGAEAPAMVGQVTDRYDVIIVGSGAGGGTLAHTRDRGHRDVHAHVEVLAQHVMLGQAHVVEDLPQLVVKAVGAVNPALTAMANAIRVGEHLLGRLTG
jgi:thioredoxin reductase